MSTQRAGEYIETISPQGYINNREITNLPGHFLVKGSKNTRIINKEKVAVSKRYELLGEASDINNPIISSYDWKTNTGVYRNIRGYLGTKAELEVWYEEAWTRFKNGYQSADFRWIPYWLSSELLDVLVGVNGTDKLFMWSGGITEIYEVTASTLTKKQYYSNDTFTFNNSARTIVDTDSLFVARGFVVGEEITISGTTFNDGNYTIKTVEAGTITLIETDVLADENSGATVVIKDTYTGTWGQARFLAATSGRAVLIGGQSYTYTGGEGSGTLTGLTLSPVALGVVAGDLAFQDVVESSPATLDGLELNLVSVVNNHLHVASERDRRVFMSANDDYDDFAYTSPLRVPGEGYVLTLDSCPTELVPDEDEMYISAGDDDWYRVFTEFTADQGGESVLVKKLKTGPGQAAVGYGAVAHIKNNIAFVSKEKTFDTLGNVENIQGPQSIAISDDIKDDFENYDLTNVHALYYRRSVFIALPAEGLVLEYDMRFQYWQPPQELPVRRLAVIDDELCGHSSNSNETYKLYTGYNDNGAPFKAVAAFGYENFGSRFMLKSFTEAATELYSSRNTIVKNRILYDYKGAGGIREFSIDGSDERISFIPPALAGLGQEKLGSNPLGGSLDDIEDLVKIRAIDTTELLTFFERQRVFEAEGADIRFEILAFGENIEMSDNVPNFIKR